MTNDGESLAGARVGLVHMNLSPESLRSLWKDSSKTVFKIVRRRWLKGASATATLLSGAEFTTHGVGTWLVPKDGPSDGEFSKLCQEGFRFRRSTETNRPLLWHRLAGHGIESIIIGSQFDSSGLDGIHEVNLRVLRNSASVRSVPLVEAAFKAMQEAQTRQDQARFHLLSLYLPSKKSVAGDADPMDTDHDAVAGASGDLPSIPSMILRFKEMMSLDHVLVLYAGNGIEWLTYHGNRELGSNSLMITPGALVATVLDLFGLPKVADVSGISILETIEENATVDGRISWELPADGEEKAPDLSGVVTAAIRGEGGPVMRAVAKEETRLAWESCHDSAVTGDLVKLARDLVAIDDSAIAYLHLCISLSRERNLEEFEIAREKIHAAYPDSMIDRLVDLLPISGKSNEERSVILEQNPIETFTDPHLRGLWARNAIAVGRIDDGLAVLWQRIRSGWASHREYIVFAAKSIERNNEQDLERAKFALHRCIPYVSSPERRSKLVRMLAEVHVQLGDSKQAIAVLERFLRRFPGEMGATGMLQGLRRKLGD